MTDPIPTPIAQLADALHRAGSDDLARFRALTEALDAIPDLQRALAARRAEVVQRLKVGRTWEEVGPLVGLHASRASQIARGVSGGSKRRPSVE